MRAKEGGDDPPLSPSTSDRRNVDAVRLHHIGSAALHALNQKVQFASKIARSAEPTTPSSFRSAALLLDPQSAKI